MPKEIPGSEEKVAAIQDALADLRPGQQQTILIPFLATAISEGMSDQTLVTIEDFTTREHTRRINEGLSAVEQAAQKLAARTRTEGLGYLDGVFPPRLDGDYWLPKVVKGFFKGIPDVTYSIDEQTRKPFNGNRNLSNMTQAIPLSSSVRDLCDTPHRQIWAAQRYVYPFSSFQPSDSPSPYPTDYNGQRIPEDWTHYQYIMPSEVRDVRVGMTVKLTTVVPSTLASDVDRAVAQDPYFPDRYFKALYPGFVGEDLMNDIRRKPAKELLIVDLRKNSDPTAGVVVPYPKPIPF